MQDLWMRISRIIDFLRTDIWRMRLAKTPGSRSFLLKQLRIVVLAVRGFDEDKCQLRASALTFYSLLSLVPVAAMAFGVAKGFGFEKRLERELLEGFPGQQEILAQIIGFANSMLENTKGSTIAGVGLILLFWTVIKVLSHIEQSFNDVWEIRDARSLVRKLGDYLSIMFIGPILVLISSSVTVFLKTQITLITDKIALLGMLSPLVSFTMHLFPYFVIWSLFTFIYMFVPNTRVDFRSGLLAGVVAGTIFQITQLLYISFQVGVAKYNAIYGSFAALPLFLIWLQFSWLIVLFGAEISFAHQNVDTYEFEPDCKQISPSLRALFSLRIAHLLVKSFSRGEGPMSAAQVSHVLDMPVRLVRQILHELVDSAVLSQTMTDDDRTSSYQPARDISTLTIQSALEALLRNGTDDVPVAQTEELRALSDALEAFADTIRKSPENRLLKEI